MLVNVVRRLRRKHYETNRILLRSHFIIEDLFFNAILIRANQIVKDIAADIDETIPTRTLTFMNKASKSIDELWNEEDQCYYSRLFITREHIPIKTVASLMPLYSGTISKERAKQLVAEMKNDELFNANYPLPSVPLNSPYFNHRRYWQGPTWLNINWLIIDGLERYGFKDEAQSLRNRSIELVERSGFSEYFSPIDGFAAGVNPFSWTAALTIDLLKHSHKK
jgi:glycogen debranching enzyme